MSFVLLGILIVACPNLKTYNYHILLKKLLIYDYITNIDK
jgi:hypothetical protein